MNIERGNFEELNNQETPKIEMIPKTARERAIESERPTGAQLEFYIKEIEGIKNAIDEMKTKGLNTKDLELKLEKYETLRDKTEKDLEIGHA